MKKAYIYLLFCISLLLSGCTSEGIAPINFSFIYEIDAFLSFLLLIGCFLLVKNNKGWFLLLFSSVLMVNLGYSLLATSTNLESALMMNRISYFGSVFLPLSMLMIILKETNTTHKKWVPQLLFVTATIVFLIAASPGILDLYYKEVSFAIIEGSGTLIKVYGPLHPVYYVYLFGYFGIMVYVILHAKKHKTIDNPVHAIIIASAVFVNILVWFIEQIANIDFEMLSISYIISELFLLGVHLVISENKRLQELVKQVETMQEYNNDSTGAPVEQESIDPYYLETYMRGLKQLTPTEKTIYKAHIERLTTKEILTKMNIKENTLKYHNKNIYGKLGISSKKELLEMHKYATTIKSKLQDMEKEHE